MTLKMKSSVILGGIELPEVQFPYTYYTIGGRVTLDDSSHHPCFDLIEFEPLSNGEWQWGYTSDRGYPGGPPVRWYKVSKSTPSKILTFLAKRRLGIL